MVKTITFKLYDVLSAKY